jgi:hypothetical protein
MIRCIGCTRWDWMLSQPHTSPQRRLGSPKQIAPYLVADPSLRWGDVWDLGFKF